MYLVRRNEEKTETDQTYDHYELVLTEQIE